jgi:hypothetical protein
MDTENKDLQGQDKDLQKDLNAREDQEKLKKDVSLPNQEEKEENEELEDEEPKERKKSYFDRFMDIGGNSGGSSI